MYRTPVYKTRPPFDPEYSRELAEFRQSEFERAAVDPMEYAKKTLIECMVGREGDKNGDIRRRAALDVLGGALLRAMTPEELLREAERLERKRQAKENP